ncbi:MAG: proline--tRNA ligase, partial [archaeon]
RLEIGPRDLGQQQAVLVRRDTGEKKIVSLAGIDKVIEAELEAMHQALFAKAEQFLTSSIVNVKTMKEFEDALAQRKIIRMLFCGKVSCEKALKEKTTASSRCVPLDEKPVNGGLCVHCSEPAEWYTLFSKAY